MSHEVEGHGRGPQQPEREKSVLLSDLPEECLSAVLILLPIAAVARCAAACSTINEVASQDATWRALCLGMPAFEALAPHAARVELDTACHPAGWRQVAKRLKNAPRVPTSLVLPGVEGVDRCGVVHQRRTAQGQNVVHYAGGERSRARACPGPRGPRCTKRRSALQGMHARVDSRSVPGTARTQASGRIAQCGPGSPGRFGTASGRDSRFPWRVGIRRQRPPDVSRQASSCFAGR